MKKIIKDLRVKINTKRVMKIGSSDDKKIRPIVVNLGRKDENTVYSR